MHRPIFESLENAGYENTYVDVQPYNPLAGVEIEGFYSINDTASGLDRWLAYHEPDSPKAVIWPLPETERKLGHGILLMPHLTEHASGTVADLGCGRSIFHGSAMAQLGAELVFGIDIEPADEFVCSTELGRTFYVEGDIFDDRLLQRWKFDTIVTHPPMIPVADESDDTDHDVAGPTGREVLDQVIKHWTTKLNPQGQLVIGQFDFLGLTSAYGEPPSTAEVLGSAGLTIEQAHTYEIPITDTIRESMDLIQTVYPDYPFEHRDGSTYHGFSVVNARMNG